VSKQHAALTRQVADSARVVEQAATALQALGFDPEHRPMLEASLKTAEAKAGRLREECERRWAGLAGRVEFNYSDPERGFDRGRVKGVVARLVQLQQPGAAVAVEVAAGNKLFQVVVDSEVTGKALLQRGKLHRRVTLIPLNKISANSLSQRILDAASEVASALGGSATPTLDLVTFDPELASAMEYVFGGSFVCDRMETAKAVCFHKSVRVRTVTPDGDSFDPSGLLSGGSRAPTQPLLAALAELSALQKELADADAAVQALRQQLQAASAVAAAAAGAAETLELSQHAHSLLEQQLAGSRGAELATAAEAQRAQLAIAISDAEAARCEAADADAAAGGMEAEEAA
jgi:structural maintenance of chromosome 2